MRDIYERGENMDAFTVLVVISIVQLDVAVWIWIGRALRSDFKSFVDKILKELMD